MADGGSNERSEVAEAFRAWHRGEALTDRQRDLIDLARVQCLARAHGVDLGPANAVSLPASEPSWEG